MNTSRLSPDLVRILRLRSQLLHPASAISDVAQLVKVLCGIQAQELPSALLAVRPRSNHLLAEDVRRAREEDRSIILTWCMRGTMHLIPAEDLGWLLPIFGPLYIQKGQRRYRQLGLDSETLTHGTREIKESLNRRGPLIRSELAEALAAKGIPVQGQAIAHLVRYAALQGAICFGPEQEGKLTYALLKDWIQPGKKLDSEKALAELAHRYLGAYGPAAPADLASWAGISMSQARSGFEAVSGELREVDLPDATGWMLKQHSEWLEMPSGDPILLLLPRFDEYLLGYQSRDFIVSSQYAKRIHPGGGQIRAAVILDGIAIGNWKIERKRRGCIVIVQPFESLPEGILPLLEAETQDLGRFLQVETELRVESID